jgi:glycosyltransferase involved in cell wall biosynthesis
VAPLSTAPSQGFRTSPRTLAGATILQLVPSLREQPVARTVVEVAHALLQAGARALVGAEGGPLASELTAAGAEWIPLATETINPFRLRSTARAIEQLIAFERVDIIHAHGPGAAYSARLAANEIAVWLVTTLPDAPSIISGLMARHLGALAQGDRVIAPSNYAAAPIMERYGLQRERLTIIPRGVDTTVFDPAIVPPARAAALRKDWRVAANQRIVLVPGRVAPWNGQMILPEVARMLTDVGGRGFVFVLVGEHQSYPKYARKILQEVQMHDVESAFRIVGHCRDMPGAFAASDVVAVPALEPPLLGRVVAQAQAMGRPVVTTDVGVLPEHVATPLRLPEDVRTGWVTAPGNAADFAHALQSALALDPNDYVAMAARAREFAEYMFSPASVAVATRAVYTSLLARDL